MSTPTIGKQLNKLFEEVYLLIEDVTKTLDYKNENTKYIENEIYKFMDTVKIECEWDMDDDEREFIGDLYFEAGHNGVDAVYYPFDNNQTDIKNILFTVNELLEIWDDCLECVTEYSENEEHIKYAQELIEQINKYI